MLPDERLYMNFDFDFDFDRVRKFLIVLKMCRCATILYVWFPGCPLLRGMFVLKSHVGRSNLVRCPESRSVRPSEVIYVSAFVRCREVVRFSEGPLWEVRLYTCVGYLNSNLHTDCTRTNQCGAHNFQVTGPVLLLNGDEAADLLSHPPGLPCR